MSQALKKSGTVVFVGRPNAGKSTLMNRLLGEKVAIVSNKPQTTRHRIVGVLSEPRGQLVFLDTPGVHRPLHRLNREMMRSVRETLLEADVRCLILDSSVPSGRGDQFVRDLVEEAPEPRLLVLNKIDRVDKPSLLPLIERYRETFDPIVPLSARTGEGCSTLCDELLDLLPEGEPAFEEDLLTPHTLRFLVAERIREKVLEETRDELPFTTAVLVERWEEADGQSPLRLYATILVEKPSQKKIVLGRGGQKIRTIGTKAREDIERFLEQPVYLELFVRVQPGWREDRSILAKLQSDVLA